MFRALLGILTLFLAWCFQRIWEIARIVNLPLVPLRTVSRPSFSVQHSGPGQSGSTSDVQHKIPPTQEENESSPLPDAEGTDTDHEDIVSERIRRASEENDRPPPAPRLHEGRIKVEDAERNAGIRQYPRIEWPNAVRRYVLRSFLPNNAIPGIDVEERNRKLKAVILDAYYSDALNATEWEVMALPQEMIQQEMGLTALEEAFAGFENPFAASENPVEVDQRSEDTDIAVNEPTAGNTDVDATIPAKIEAEQTTPDEPNTVAPGTANATRSPRQEKKRKSRSASRNQPNSALALCAFVFTLVLPLLMEAMALFIHAIEYADSGNVAPKAEQKMYTALSEAAWFIIPFGCLQYIFNAGFMNMVGRKWRGIIVDTVHWCQISFMVVGVLFAWLYFFLRVF